MRVDTERFNSSLRAPKERSNPDEIASSAFRPPRNDYFLFVGALDRAHYFKGLSLLLRAFKFVDSGSRQRRVRNDTNVAAPAPDRDPVSGMTESPRLVVVGTGELLNAYKKEAAHLGIADRVTFTGGVTDEELARWYAGARAEILPSTDRSEAFGIVLIEAMACGTPVIASDLPGVRTVVERVHGGVLVPVGIASSLRGATPRNDSLILALQQAWNTPWSAEERTALAVRAASVYGRATLADQLIAWYHGIITT